MDPIYHYSAELLELLAQTVPRLFKESLDVLDFFRRAGTPEGMLQDFEGAVRHQKSAQSKYDIARVVLVRLSDIGDENLRVRREVVRRVTEFDDFSGGWDIDRLKARRLVRDVRSLVNVGNWATRMNTLRERAEEN